MVSIAAARKIALACPDSVEGEHRGHQRAPTAPAHHPLLGSAGPGKSVEKGLGARGPDRARRPPPAEGRCLGRAFFADRSFPGTTGIRGLQSLVRLFLWNFGVPRV